MEKIFKNRQSILIIGLGLFVAGIFHWTIPYSDMNMFSRPFILKWSISAILIAATGVSVFSKTILKASLLTTFGFISAVMLRVIYDTTFIDSTSHNLWPFEVIIALMIVFPASLIGALLSHFLIGSLFEDRFD